MSYASRPMGDYRTYGYAGDPGFLSSLWKGIKKIAPTIIGAAIGGPIGAVVGAAGGGGGRPALPAPPGTLGGAISFPGGTMVSGAYQLTGGQMSRSRAQTMPGKFAGGRPGGGDVCPTGYHLAKDGSGRMVRNRRMNIANPRALRRAMRRVQGFEKLAKRTIQFTRRTKIKKRAS